MNSALGPILPAPDDRSGGRICIPLRSLARYDIRSPLRIDSRLSTFAVLHP